MIDVEVRLSIGGYLKKFDTLGMVIQLLSTT